MSKCRVVLALLILWTFAAIAEAGMPSFTLSDVPVTKTRSLAELVRMRLEVISFFSGVLLLSAAAIRWIWNSLRNDFPRLPRISYAKALGVVFLWGLLFLLVLTMISGARELMTPGAWVKRGFTYKLAEPEPSPQARLDVARYQGIARLRDALSSAAAAADPIHDSRDWMDPETHQNVRARVPASAWLVPGANQLRYILEQPRAESAGRGDDSDRPAAYEPEGVGTYRLVILRNDMIRAMTTAELHRALKKTGDD
jgi:hypothetical protein